FFDTLKTFAASLESDAGRIILENAGVGTQSYSCTFPEYQLANEKRNTANKEVPIYRLDDYFADQPVTLIKADIEGAELDMLRGCEEILRRDRPKVAVCVYHYAEDILRIPAFLKKVVPEYQFSLRHHSKDWPETVLYAYTPQHNIFIEK
ncbi:MAG TPA: FkbM family methyltransferase, partial [Patescibacteria group bacterium]|nr:FkbM family methyltransferase [Patescibacteria group bacterium]